VRKTLLLAIASRHSVVVLRYSRSRTSTRGRVRNNNMELIAATSRAWLLIALLSFVGGCATQPAATTPLPVAASKGGASGRYLVSEDPKGMSLWQFTTESPKHCDTLKMMLGASPGARCTDVDLSTAMPYSVTTQLPIVGALELNTNTTGQCRYWAQSVGTSTSKKASEQPPSCQDRTHGGGGRRYYQYVDQRGVVYAELDFGAETNCQKFGRYSERSGNRPPPGVQRQCSAQSKATELPFVANLMQGDVPVLELQARSKSICEALAKAPAGSQGGKQDCKLKL